MILVMGATGKVGSKITAHLLANGQKVRCVARHFPNRAAYPGAEFAEGDANNVSFLTDAMRGCKSVFTLIPPNFLAKEVRYYQNKFGEVVAEAIEEAGIKKVVNLSSVGADLESGTGPILGLHDQEQRLNEITRADIVHLRPTYFMENLIDGIPGILSFNQYFNSFAKDVPVPMIASRDIAARAAFLLMNPDFNLQTEEYLLGERDISFDEVIKILGQAIKKPNLEYVELSATEMKKRMMGAGIPEDWADGFNDMATSFNNGTIAGTLQRNKVNTTATSIEEFARTTFADAYRKAVSDEVKRRTRASSEPEARP